VGAREGSAAGARRGGAGRGQPARAAAPMGLTWWLEEEDMWGPTSHRARRRRSVMYYWDKAGAKGSFCLPPRLQADLVCHVGKISNLLVSRVEEW